MCVSILLLFLVLFAVSNYIIGQMRNDTENHEYRVEISRLCRRIAAGEEPDLHSCKYVIDVRAYDGSSSFYSLSGTFAVQEVNGNLYRFDYLPGNSSYRIRVIVNGVLAVMLLMIAAMLFYIYRMLLIPFRKMNDLPKSIETTSSAISAALKEDQQLKAKLSSIQSSEEEDQKVLDNISRIRTEALDAINQFLNQKQYGL